MSTRMMRRRRRRYRRNSTWDNTIRGEWWITGDGEVWFADQDIGEMGHEAIALDHMLDGDILADGLVEMGAVNPSDVSDELGGAYYYLNFNIPDRLGINASNQSVWEAIEKEGAREAFMQHYGAIMVIGECFTSWKITGKTIEAVQNFICEQFEDIGSSAQLVIEAFGNRRYAIVTWGEFQFVKKPGELIWS